MAGKDLIVGACTYSYKVGVFRIPNGYYGVNFFNQLLFLIVFKVHVPFGQPGFARPILDKDEPNLQTEKGKEGGGMEGEEGVWSQ